MSKLFESWRFLLVVLAVWAAVFVSSLTSTTHALPVGSEVHLEGQCGLLDAYNGDCQHIVTENVYVRKSEESNPRRKLYVLTRPTIASCLLYTVYAEYPDVGNRWGNWPAIYDVSHAIPFKSHRNSRRWDLTAEGKYTVYFLRLRVKFDSFIGSSIVPDCKKRGVFPPGNTITNDTQLRYNAVVRLTGLKKSANWKSRRWDVTSPPSEDDAPPQ